MHIVSLNNYNTVSSIINNNDGTHRHTRDLILLLMDSKTCVLIVAFISVSFVIYFQWISSVKIIPIDATKSPRIVRPESTTSQILTSLQKASGIYTDPAKASPFNGTVLAVTRYANDF
jgi:hypothetical protein